MFTGIVEEIGTINSLIKIGENQVELAVKCQLIQEDMKIGDSIAVNGVCLTVIRFNDSVVTFEISPETIRHSTFSIRRPGDNVNLERALRLSDRLGGHIVQGHVDCVSEVMKIKELGGFFEIDFSLPGQVKRYVVKKGSITIDGISLTIADLGENWFRVAVIPHTYKQTVLSHRKIGDKVHIESDVLARYVENLLIPAADQEKKSVITEEFLKNHGF